MTVDEYVALPWTVRGREVREAPEDAPYYLLTIEEMPGFSIVAPTRAEAEGMYPAELREYIEAMVESRRAVPIPAAAA
jgi:predicted RNase H-like HicB family nuclease